MNILLVIRMLSSILLVEAASMIPSMAVAMAHGDGDVLPLFYTALIILAFAVPGFYFVHPKDKIMITPFFPSFVTAS